MELTQIHPNPDSQDDGQSFEKYLINRRRQLQDWGDHPPKKLAWVIFSLAVIEFVVARNLMHGLGMSRSIVGDIVSIGLSILFLEVFFAKIASQTAELFNKKGRWQSAFHYFNIGLYPMLFYLPVTLLIWSLGDFTGIRMLIFIALLLWSLVNWRESAEISHELTKFQSLLVIYSGIGILFFVAAVISYASIVASFVELIGLGQ